MKASIPFPSAFAYLLGLLSWSCHDTTSSHGLVQQQQGKRAKAPIVAEANSQDSQGDTLWALYQSVIRDGDVRSYERLKYMYRNRAPEEAFFWSYVMAEKHHYAEAYYEMYSTYALLSQARGMSLRDFSHEDREIAKSFLTKAAALGHPGAIDLLKE
jgi:hypothetical protein